MSPQRIVIQIFLDPEQLTQVEQLARKERVSRSQFIRTCVAERLEREPKQPNEVAS